VQRHRHHLAARDDAGDALVEQAREAPREVGSVLELHARDRDVERRAIRTDGVHAQLASE
jgi:hypothetical protein